MLYFTSDEHLSHQNIIKYCNRPFKDVKEMDDTIISNFNSKVGKKDIIYHLGDFSFHNPKEYLARMNGVHILIRGNHDSKQSYGFEKVFDVLLLKNAVPNFHIYLSHYAGRVWPHSHHCAGMLYGHSHGTLEPYGRSFDVGVDTNNFMPYSLDDVIEKFTSLDPIRVFGNDPLKMKES